MRRGSLDQRSQDLQLGCIDHSDPFNPLYLFKIATARKQWIIDEQPELKDIIDQQYSNLAKYLCEFLYIQQHQSLFIKEQHNYMWLRNFSHFCDQLYSPGLKALPAPPEKKLLTYPAWEESKRQATAIFGLFASNRLQPEQMTASATNEARSSRLEETSETYCGFKPGFLVGQRF